MIHVPYSAVLNLVQLYSCEPPSRTDSVWSALRFKQPVRTARAALATRGARCTGNFRSCMQLLAARNEGGSGSQQASYATRCVWSRQKA